MPGDFETEKKCPSEVPQIDQCDLVETKILSKNKNDVIIATSTENECEQLMERIYDGNYLLVPHFAQTLISYLYEDMPASDNPRVLCHHIATRGMNIMGKAHKLGELKKEEEEEKKLQLEYKSSIVQFTYLRDICFLCCGVLWAFKYYNTFTLLLYFIYKTCKEYRITKHAQMIDFIFIIVFAYNWCY